MWWGARARLLGSVLLLLTRHHCLMLRLIAVQMVELLLHLQVGHCRVP